MVITVRVNFDYNPTEDYYIGLKVSDNLLLELNPIRTNDSLELCLLDGGIPSYSVEHRNKLQLRGDAIENLSKELARALVDQISKKDTHNGY